MAINILLFGATADIVGERRIEMQHSGTMTSRALLEQIQDKFPNLCRHKLLYSLNQNYATGDEIIRDGDELAIFTAVSGG